MEIILNWNGYYIGATFDKQSYYQFAAKAHEITLQTSLVSMALSYIRYLLAFGNGVPFGAFLSGLQITQISYLWSTELWSSLFVSSKIFPLRSKLTFLTMITICGLIAATAGPSSAVLLIPRQTWWPSEPTYFYVNGTFEDLWPDKIDAKRIPNDCAVISSSSAVDPVCPAADFLYLAENIFEFSMSSSALATTIFPMLNPDATYRSVPVNLCVNSANYQYCGSSQPVIALMGASKEAKDYTHRLLKANISFMHLLNSIDNGYYQSYVISNCVSDTFQETEDQKPLQFARITETGLQGTHNRTIIAIPGLPSALTAPGNVSEYRLQWVTLPRTNFSNAAIGAVLLHPRVAGSQSQNITTCTLGAGWGTSSVSTYLDRSDRFGSTITGVPSYFLTSGMPDFATISGYAYPQRRIEISEDWAQFLNPIFTKADGSNTTMINHYMSASVYQFEEISISKVMSVVLAAGLSLVGSDLSWQGMFLTRHPDVQIITFSSDPQ